MIKKTILKLIHKFGYQLHRLDSPMKLSNSTMECALERLALFGVRPEKIIDVGAAKGRWTMLCKKYYPHASYSLIEPLIEQIDSIDKSLLGPRDEIINAVLGASSGTVSFNISEDLDGSGIYGSADNQRQIRMLPLSDVIQNKSTLIKLDTHGYEIPILEGIHDQWESVDAFVVEVYGFHVSPTARLFHEISAFLFEKGYRLFDIVDLERRLKDGALWQADAIYLKTSHPVFLSNSYV